MGNSIDLNKNIGLLESTFGNIYAKLLEVLDAQKRYFRRKYNVVVDVNDDELITDTIFEFLPKLYGKKIKTNPAGYCIIILKRKCYQAFQENLNLDRELDDYYYKIYQEYLDLHEEGEIHLTDKEIRQYKEIIRRCKQKAKLFSQPIFSSVQRVKNIEGKLTYKIDHNKIRVAAKKALKGTTKRRRQVFLKNLKRKSQREVAKELGVSESNVCQLLDAAEEDMTEMMSKEGFKKEDFF